LSRFRYFLRNDGSLNHGAQLLLSRGEFRSDRTSRMQSTLIRMLGTTAMLDTMVLVNGTSLQSNIGHGSQWSDMPLIKGEEPSFNQLC
jgi:hypothetical protein